MRNAARLEERVLAAMVAENLLNEATALEAKSKKRARHAHARNQFAYRIKRQVERRDDAAFELIKVTVDITRQGKDKTLASLVGYQRPAK